MISTGGRWVVSSSIVVGIIEKGGSVFYHGFVDREGDTIWATGGVARLHDDFCAKFWIDFNDVLMVDLPVEVVEDGGGSLVVVRFPGPSRGPEVGGYGSHGGRVGGGGCVSVGTEGGETIFGVGKGVADALEVV